MQKIPPRGLTGAAIIQKNSIIHLINYPTIYRKSFLIAA
jgi:hypothetical protein